MAVKLQQLSSAGSSFTASKDGQQQPEGFPVG